MSVFSCDVFHDLRHHLNPPDRDRKLDTTLHAKRCTKIAPSRHPDNRKSRGCVRLGVGRGRKAQATPEPAGAAVLSAAPVNKSLTPLLKALRLYVRSRERIQQARARGDSAETLSRNKPHLLQLQKNLMRAMVHFDIFGVQAQLGIDRHIVRV